ncbi:hypothetical protein [Poseidonocella sedimentorum]|uniref:AAA+ family ATPase n=1 Tax=Poseidonocella sedimentorum TaxID=871652 RepID=A0A1I6CTB1_9RHOB|nr:hypothetical protein [Poseidonocella sedimentorum]SFQ96352.1 hypothetical protein SAMN04515673_101325 [Poseidonocella sedimentorum]
MSRLLALLCCLALPATAQEADPPSRMEEGARLFFEGLMEEMGPALEGLQGFGEEMGPEMRRLLDEMGPALRDILGQIDDLSHYAPPEMLPNGDIILRRRDPMPEAPAPDSAPERAPETDPEDQPLGPGDSIEL